MVAAGAPLTVTLAVVLKTAHPPVEGRVYLMVYVPAVAPEGVISPVNALTGSPPAGVTEKLPPAVPVSVTAIGGLGFAAVLIVLQMFTGL